MENLVMLYDCSRYNLDGELRYIDSCMGWIKDKGGGADSGILYAKYGFAPEFLQILQDEKVLYTCISL